MGLLDIHMAKDWVEGGFGLGNSSDCEIWLSRQELFLKKAVGPKCRILTEHVPLDKSERLHYLITSVYNNIKVLDQSVVKPAFLGLLFGALFDASTLLIC